MAGITQQDCILWSNSYTGEKVTVTITEELTDVDTTNNVMYLVVIGVSVGANIVLLTIIGVMCWRMKKKEITSTTRSNKLQPILIFLKVFL